MRIHVNVRLADWKYEWRTVQASSLSDAFEVAKKMPGVEAVLEASFVPGGVVT